MLFYRKIWLCGTASMLALIFCTGCSKNMNAPANPRRNEHSGKIDTISNDIKGKSIFTDIAKSSGINYVWKTPGKRPLNILQTIGNGAAFLDYDGDGNLDILLAGPKLALYQGDGKGHFKDVTSSTGLDRIKGNFLGCAVGDIDNDGFEDIYLTAFRGGALLHNEAGKTFKDITVQSGIRPQPWGTSASFADVDNDGKLDLYIGNYVVFGPNVQPQLCKYVGIDSSCGPRFYKPEFGALYKNIGRCRFEDASRAMHANGVLDAASGTAAKDSNVTGKCLGVAIADMDNSGWQSISLSNDEVAGDLLQNVHGKFKNIGAAAGTAYDNDGSVHGGMGLDWGDFDNDGKIDLVVSTFQREAKNIYHNDGNGTFSDNSAILGLSDASKPFVSFGVKWIDYDNDGFLDLILVSGHVQDNISAIEKTTPFKQTTQLYHNENGKSFTDRSSDGGPALQVPIMGRGLAIGDFDNDGRQDILLVDSDGAPMLLHNESAKAAHWISCRLIGIRSNRDGIGAKVTAEVHGVNIYRYCHTDGSYMSASDRRVHFGIGNETKATLTVHWPSGKIDIHKDVPADQIITLKETE